MTFWLHITRKLVMVSLLAGLVASFGVAQSMPQARLPAASQQEPAAISRVKILLGKGSPAVEIMSTRPVVPTITKMEDPLRLVIDLQNANMSVRRKRIEIHNEDISAIRMDQYMTTPPVVRVVVDLLKPVSYTWDAAGNRLMIRLHEEGEDVTAKPPSVTALGQGEEPAAVPVSAVGSGNIVLADTLKSGASLSAGADVTLLRLTRGGEIRVCPATTVSVTHSQNGQDLMVSMSTGAVETHYALENASDSIFTPDFYIVLRGPGEFHYAISADAHGKTCVSTLPGNTAPAIVSELIGEGSYEVQPGEHVVFHSGHLETIDEASASACACPAPAVPVMRASASPTGAISETNLPSSFHLAQPGDEAKPSDPEPVSPPPSQASLSETATLPVPDPHELHVQVDAPLVFPDQTRPAAKPAPIADGKNLPADHSVRPPALPTVVQPPPPAQQAQARKPHRGVLGSIKGFFAGIFR